MSKVNILVEVKSTDDDITTKTKAIKQKETLRYKENERTMVRFNYQDISLLRENNELRMNYYFDKDKSTKGKIFIKELEKEIEVEIITKNIKRKGNDIEIKFEVENNEFLYRIEEIK